MRQVYDQESHAHFVTFSCYKRRRLLDSERSRQIILGVLSQLLQERESHCLGFVVMPDHMHALLWLPEPNRLATFMQLWKGRSARILKQHMRDHLSAYSQQVDADSPFWQRRYYDFNVYDHRKAEEKLTYMHMNPVRAELATDPLEWKHSSLAAYVDGRSVGVPISSWEQLA